MMIPIKSNEKAYLMEFKISKTKNEMEKRAQKVLKQIDEKKYLEDWDYISWERIESCL